MRASWLLLLVCGVAAAQDFEFATILVAQTYEQKNKVIALISAR